LISLARHDQVPIAVRRKARESIRRWDLPWSAAEYRAVSLGGAPTVEIETEPV
jgi:hypothetical protein